MKTYKRIYIVRGSEDGNIGVYTNLKLAYNRALEYAGNNPKIYNGSKNQISIYKKGSYGNVCSYFKKYRFASLTLEGDSVESTIELFELNKP